MAQGKHDSQEESNPLLPQVNGQDGEKADNTTTNNNNNNADSKTGFDAPTEAVYPASATCVGNGIGWTADGLPLGQGSVVGEPMGRAQWDSSLLSILGRNDEFCSSDLEVCLLGSIAPCVLYGSNAERLGSSPGNFANPCLTYTGLYLLGNSLFGWNCLAPWFSYSSRVAIRRKFNLEGSCEALNRPCGCCGSLMEDEFRREQCETACDFATHVFCHTCALCQEGRELRRRLPHPGFNVQPVLVMIAPADQTMGRDA